MQNEVVTPPNAPILVTGGTGTLGRVVVRRLRERGDEVRVLSRREGDGLVTGDLASGRGLDTAINGVGAIVHLATTNRDDTAITRNLVDAAERNGRPRIVYQSIVGVDRIPLHYYGGKLASERIIAESRLLWTVLRATQFHDLVATLFRVQRYSPVVLAPAFSFQPIDVRDVTTRLVELLDADAAGMAPDLGGPEVRPAPELARAWLDARDSRRAIWRFSLPGRRFGAYRAGENLVPGEPYGTITFDQFLGATR